MERTARSRQPLCLRSRMTRRRGWRRTVTRPSHAACGTVSRPCPPPRVRKRPVQLVAAGAGTSSICFLLRVRPSPPFAQFLSCFDRPPQREGGTPKADPSIGCKDGPPSAFRAGFGDLATSEPLRDPMASDASHPRPDLPSPSHGDGLGCLRTLKRTDPQTPRSRRRVGGAARSSGTRALRKGPRRRRRPPRPSPFGSGPWPRTIPAIARPVWWAGGDRIMQGIGEGVDFFLSRGGRDALKWQSFAPPAARMGVDDFPHAIDADMGDVRDRSRSLYGDRPVRADDKRCFPQDDVSRPKGDASFLRSEKMKQLEPQPILSEDELEEYELSENAER